MTSALRTSASCRLRTAGVALAQFIVFAGIGVARLQAEEPPPFVALEAFVVTATRTETPLWASPVAISLTTREAIERRPAASVAELLRDVPGVMIADNTLPGMQRLRIRGEDARRCLVLIDGQEVSDHTTYGPPLLVDPAFIERIEVVRGPHSTLFGSRAEGGVVNIITRRAGEAAREGTMSLAYSGATDGFRAKAGFAGRADAWDWRVGYSRTHDGDRHTPAGVLPDSATSSEAFNGRFGWTHGMHEVGLLLDRHRMQSEASTSERIVDGVGITSFLLDLPQRDRDKVGLVYDGRDLSPRWRNLHADIFWQTIDRRLTQAVAGTIVPVTSPPVFYDYFNDDLDTVDTWGLNAHAEWRLVEAHQVVAGFSWLRDRLDKSLVRTGTRSRAGVVTPANLTAMTAAGIDTTALFAQDTWQFARRWRAVAGARQYFVTSRLDASSDPALTPRRTTDRHLIGSATLVYTPVERVAVRAGWSQGYVYPTLLHQHTGSLFAQGNLTRPNPNLRPETSENFELGVRWQHRRGAIDVAAFSATARDYIESVRASTVPELGWAPNENTYANLQRSRTRGIEASASLQLGGQAPAPEVYAQATYLRRAMTYPTFTSTENGQPQLSGRAGVRWDGRRSSGVTWYADVYGAAGGRSMLRTTRSREEVAGWATVNLATGVRWGKRPMWSVNGELLNLGDKEYRPAADELVQPGRHVNLNVRVEF